MDVRIANSEDPDQTASEEAVWPGSALFVLAVLAGNKCSKSLNIYRKKGILLVSMAMKMPHQ